MWVCVVWFLYFVVRLASYLPVLVQRALGILLFTLMVGVSTCFTCTVWDKALVCSLAICGVAVDVRPFVYFTTCEHNWVRVWAFRVVAMLLHGRCFCSLLLALRHVRLALPLPLCSLRACKACGNDELSLRLHVVTVC